ncbi:MAG: response regulator transcription factor [Blastocatellia bacterium]
MRPASGCASRSDRSAQRQSSHYKTSKEIADELGVSHRTIETHRANISAKLELRGSHSLMKFALSHKSEL